MERVRHRLAFAFHALPVVFDRSQFGNFLRRDIAVVENRGCQIGPGDEGIGSDALFFLCRIPHDQWQVHARLIKVRFRAGEGRSVIAEEHDQRVFPVAGFFECVDQRNDALVETRNRLVVFRQLFLDFLMIGQPRRHDDLFGLVSDRRDAGVVIGIVVEVGETVGAAAAMRVAAAVVQKEGAVVVCGDELPGVGRHHCGVAISLDAFVAVLLELVNILRREVILADRAGAVAGFFQHDGQRLDRSVRAEVVVAVGVAVMSGRVIVQAGHDHRTAGGTTGGRAVGAG